MGRSKRSLTHPLNGPASESGSAERSHNRSASTVAERPPQLPEIDLEPLDFAVLREKRASMATNPDTNYGLDMFDVRLSYNAARRSLIREKDELPDFSGLGNDNNDGDKDGIPAVPDLPADLRVLHSSKMREVLGMDPGEETEVERDGSYTPDSVLKKKAEEAEAAAAAAAAAAAPEYIHGWRLFSVMLAITLACFLYLLDVSILVTAIPKITSDFHSLTDIGWYGATYNLASAALQPLSGKFYTYFHAKWTFLAFFLVFEIGNLLCGVATSSTMIIVGRTVAGAGASGLTNGSFAIVTACAPMEKRPQLMGILIGVCQMGLVAGPLIGGALTEFTSWRWCFYINLPVGAVTVAAFLVTAIPDKRKYVVQSDSPGKLTLRKMDMVGFLLFAPAAVMILLALEFGGNRYAWRSPTIIGLFVGGGVQVLLFLLWERRVGMTAMIPLPIIGKREVWTACVASMFMFSTMLGAGYYLPVYFQTVRGLSPLRSGVSMLPAIVTQLVVTVVSGGLVQRVGYYLPFMILSAVIIAVANGLLSTWGLRTPTVVWAGYQVLLGFGRGMAFQMPVIAIQAHTPPALASVATATMVLFQTFFGAIFLAIINTLFNTKLKKELSSRVPEIGADKIINAGAADISSVVPADRIDQVLQSYSLGVNQVFYAIAAICVCMFVFSWGTGWTDIRKKPDQKSGDV